VYDRSQDGRELNFEASGALESASLVMRDRETDSWWSLMGSRAIGGELDGKKLEELAVSEKAQWSDWVARYPQTLVLSVDGAEHVEDSPYENYFGDETRTFRAIEVPDDRLPPKQSIYSFWYGDRAVAVSHEFVEGGGILPIPDSGEVVALWREPGISFYASSRAVLLDAEAARGFADAAELFAAMDSGGVDGSRPAHGFDTFWYTWVLVNPQTELLAP
jgi:hypothetical protein